MAEPVASRDWRRKKSTTTQIHNTSQQLPGDVYELLTTMAAEINALKIKVAVLEGIKAGLGAWASKVLDKGAA